MDQEPTNNSSKKIIAAIAAVVVIAVLGIGIVAFASRSEQTTTPEANTTAVDAANTETPNNTSQSPDTSEKTSTDSTAPKATEETNASGFKNGKYTASAQYRTPGGSEAVTVTVTLADGIVTDSAVKADANEDDSKEYQDMFKSDYKQFVTGKKITDIKLSKVSGSSLTSEGFNAALEKIKEEAAI
jgi:uncharacterized protein with FMN-binding domain